MDINTLYHERLLAYARQARTLTYLDQPDYSAQQKNPHCGDHVQIDLKLNENIVSDFGGKVEGCAICEAAMGLAGHALIGADVTYAIALPLEIKSWLKRNMAHPPLDAMKHFTLVQDLVVRHQCMLLPFEAMAYSLKEFK